MYTREKVIRRYGRMLPQKIIEIRVSEMQFLAFFTFQ